MGGGSSQPIRGQYFSHQPIIGVQTLSFPLELLSTLDSAAIENKSFQGRNQPFTRCQRLSKHLEIELKMKSSLGETASLVETSSAVHNPDSLCRR